MFSSPAIDIDFFPNYGPSVIVFIGQLRSGGSNSLHRLVSLPAENEMAVFCSNTLLVFFPALRSLNRNGRDI